jgi:hypothetical protein
MLASNHTNLIALQSIQRAFLFPEMREIRTIRSGGAQGVDSIVVHFVWKNSGTTPTRHMTSDFSYGYYPDGLPPGFSFPDGPSPNAEAPTSTPRLVGPHGEVAFPVGPIPPRKIEDLLSNRTRLFVWGWAKYHDIFEGTPEHITKFCQELVKFHGDPLDPSSGAATMSSCPVHNCYDDECQRQ